MSEARPTTEMSGEQLEELRRLLLAEQERRRSLEAKPLPAWLPLVMKMLPWVLLTVTLVNLLIAVVAIITPWLAVWFGPAVTDPIYTVYSFICPQRPSHTFFIHDHPMAFEQRDVAVHFGLAVPGLLHLFWPLLRRPLPTWVACLMLAPMLVDVAISSIGLLPSTWFSRLWTGSLAGVAVIWWSYPRFDRYLRKVEQHVARLRAVRAR